ncbi:MAG TPA: O-methyltransferase [Byssovorax sp.]|jgi:predicted O-methyltransferase YrrM
MTTDERWTEVDDYFSPIVDEDAALKDANRASADAGLPAIQVAANQGKMLQLMARACGARNILEVGTLGGYSAIWLARALPEGGKLVTLEISEKHAEVARKNIARAGLANVDVRVGPALGALEKMHGEGLPPFDFTFIDADKPSNLPYFEHAIALSRKGAVIVVDNVVRAGRVVDEHSDDANVAGVRRLRDALANEQRVSATVVQTVGAKSYDGFVMAVVL